MKKRIERILIACLLTVAAAVFIASPYSCRRNKNVNSQVKFHSVPRGRS